MRKDVSDDRIHVLHSITASMMEMGFVFTNILQDTPVATAVVVVFLHSLASRAIDSVT